MRTPTLSTEDILARLVAFDTTSSLTNLPLIAWVEDYVRGLGLDAVRIMDPVQDKASLWVTAGPRDTGGVCLSSHTDVVPVAGQAWTRDPFTLIRDGDRLVGRGACDMKGFVAVCLAKLPAMAAAGLTTPIHLLLSYDEEITCEGVLPAIRRMGTDLPTPRACIVGEPTSMQVADAHKSVLAFLTTVRGREGHSSNPDAGASALVAGAMIVNELTRIAADLKARGDPSGRFDVPYSTVHIGQFQSGTARNIIPNHAKLVWECRALPGFDVTEVRTRLDAAVAERVLPYLRAVAPDATVETVMELNIPGVMPEPGSLAETLALRLAQANHTVSVNYGTEGGQFQGAGIPTVICGPGNIEQAHKPDEWIDIAQLRACEAFMDRLIEGCQTGL
jgi:acetylornithine deacetylase